MIWGLCESPITFNAIIEWSNALNEGTMQLREILDLEAMLSKGPTAEQISESEEGGEGAGGRDQRRRRRPDLQGRGRARGAGGRVRRRGGHGRAPRPRRSPRKMTRTTPSRLAQMEEALKPMALEKFAGITALYKKFAKLQLARLDRAMSKRRAQWRKPKPPKPTPRPAMRR